MNIIMKKADAVVEDAAINTGMILTADSGATKTDWCYGRSLSDCQKVQTEGINPFHQSDSHIRSILTGQLFPQLTEASSCSYIFYYGAGCLPEKTASLAGIMKELFPNVRIEIHSDLMGAARALCGNRPGIACILGTGSNSCLYDGEQIVRNTPPLGYILGDEGSGAYLGRRFISDCLKGQLPDDLRKGLMHELNMDLPCLLDRIYRQPQTNRFLASITPYIYSRKEQSEVKTFLNDCFCEFFRRNVIPYRSSLPVSFVGSIAWHFQDEIRLAAEALHLTTATFLKAPAEALAAYHFDTLSIPRHPR